MIVALWATRLALHTRACWIGHFHDDLVFLYEVSPPPTTVCCIFTKVYASDSSVWYGSGSSGDLACRIVSPNFKM